MVRHEPLQHFELQHLVNVYETFSAPNMVTRYGQFLAL